MRVLYVVSGQSYFSEAPGRKIEAIVRCWRKMGHEVELLCGGDVLPGGRRERVREGQANLARPRWYRRWRWLQPGVDTVSEVLNLRHDRRLARAVAVRIREFRPDLYWQRSSRLDGGTLATARRAGIPTVLEWKDNLLTVYGPSLLKPWAALVERRKDRSADYVVVESGVLREALAPRRNDGTSTIFVAHNAIDPAAFSLNAVRDRAAARRELGIGEDVFVPIYVGSFAWYHRVEILIDALARKSPPGEPPLRAILVGDGPGRPAVEARVRELGLDDRVQFAGRVSQKDVPRWLVASDVAVLPDCTDIITPIKVLEYMAVGLPTLAPDYPANREVIESGATGLLFEPRDPQALADALRELAGDPGRRAAVGSAASRAALERFSWRATWGRVLEEIAAQASVRHV